MYWKDCPLPQHIDQHLRPEAQEMVVTVTIGDRSANFEVPVMAVPHAFWALRRSYFLTPTALSADAASYWTFRVLQRDEDGRMLVLQTLEGSSHGLTADLPVRVPDQGNDDAALEEGLGVFVAGTKTGTPDATDDLVVTLVIALA